MPLKSSRAAFIAIIALSAAVACATFSGNRTVSAQARPAVLAQMDAASVKFTSAQADLRQELYTKAVQDTEIQTGEIAFVRSGNSTQMGMKMLAADAKPGAAPAQIVEFKDARVRVLNTGTNHVDEFAATGKNQAIADTLMSLGFGASGTDLAKAWTITDQGKDQISDGSKSVSVEKLDLVSKDPSVKSTFSHITIWVDASRGIPLKQVSYNAANGTSTGDTRTVYYTNIRLNQKVDMGQFAIKCKGKCS